MDFRVIGSVNTADASSRPRQDHADTPDVITPQLPGAHHLELRKSSYPEPAGFADYPVSPAEAYYSRDNGQFLLPYEAVRTAADPDRALSRFLHTTYEAAAECGGWDRAALEDDPSRWDHLR